jgi:hypothetical protein
MLNYFMNNVAVCPQGQVRVQPPVLPGCDIYEAIEQPPRVEGVPDHTVLWYFPSTGRQDLDDFVNCLRVFRVFRVFRVLGFYKCDFEGGGVGI